MLFNKGKLILSRYVHSRISNNSIAGCFNLVGLLSAVYKAVLHAADKSLQCGNILPSSCCVGSAMYLLEISSLLLDTDVCVTGDM